MHRDPLLTHKYSVFLNKNSVHLGVRVHTKNNSTRAVLLMYFSKGCGSLFSQVTWGLQICEYSHISGVLYFIFVDMFVQPFNQVKMVFLNQNLFCLLNLIELFVLFLTIFVYMVFGYIQICVWLYFQFISYTNKSILISF